MGPLIQQKGTMMHEITVPESAIVGAFLSIGLGFVGWIIRASARQLFQSFEKALEQHGRAIDRNSAALEAVNLKIAEIDARLRVTERWQESRD